LQQLRDKAAELKVDFLLIAGDVFDDHSVHAAMWPPAPSPFWKVRKIPARINVIPGNHDPLVPGGVWTAIRGRAISATYASISSANPQPVRVPNCQ